MYICEICKSAVDSVYFKDNKEVCEKCYRGRKVETDKAEISSLPTEEHTEPIAVAVS